MEQPHPCPNKRQSTRAAQRAQEFDQYYSLDVPLSTKIHEAPPTFFPPGEHSIATEVEQLLPPLSPGLGPWEEPTLEDPPINTKPAPPILPEGAQNRPTPTNNILDTPGNSHQATEPTLDSVPDLSRSPITTPADQINGLVQALTNQLQEHHGYCLECHAQQEREHETQHAEHPGLGVYLGRVQADGGYLDVLSAMTMARGEDNLAGKTSAAPNSHPVHVCLNADHQTGSQTRVTFDINSIVGFAHSLAVAKLGVRWNPTQRPVPDLHSSLHLDPLPVHQVSRDGRTYRTWRPVHQIPHYTFGRVEQQSPRLQEQDFRIWMDQVLLPAIYQHYDGSLVQHYPSSFDHSRFNATARGVEMRSQRVDPVAREQLLFYFLPPDALPLVWTSIQETIQQAGLQQFLDLTILIQGKNLKTLSKADTWEGMMQQFGQHWDNIIDPANLSDHFYVDIGKKTCPTGTSQVDGPGQQTLLWRRCCLDSYAAWIQQQHPPQSAPPKQQFYPISLLHDTGSLTLETSGDVYPFPNPSLETLALDPQLHKTWQHVGGGLSHNPVALVRAYLNMKQRCHAALQGSYMKVIGLREEHRVSLPLYH
ncbi:uncharacterized protein BDV14DRAFT_211863 [Aspergillus stella-maris]|uniref:uncharacterized protein n=1 Tax=Aspergillus stella-maris TaxID=1810926 RepID=UPI003CCD1773